MATDSKTTAAHALHKGGAMQHRSSPLLRAALGLLVAGTCAAQGEIVARHDKATSTITVHRDGSEQAVVTQHAQADHRPFLHPIMAPDGNGVLTENQPGHHKHQTGLYWGFTRLNGRDYFHHPEGDYWRRQISVRDGGAGVASGSLWGSGVSRRWFLGPDAMVFGPLLGIHILEVWCNAQKEWATSQGRS